MVFLNGRFMPLEEARVLANKHAPSRLHVYKKDGTIQDTFTYGD